jgi:hypothetical protein
LDAPLLWIPVRQSDLQGLRAGDAVDLVGSGVPGEPAALRSGDIVVPANGKTQPGSWELGSRTQEKKASRRRAMWSRVARGPAFRDEGRVKRRVLFALAIVIAFFTAAVIVGALDDYQTQGTVTAIGSVPGADGATHDNLVVKRRSCDCIVDVATEDAAAHPVGSTVDIPGSPTPWGDAAAGFLLFGVPSGVLGAGSRTPSPSPSARSYRTSRAGRRGDLATKIAIQHEVLRLGRRYDRNRLSRRRLDASAAS